MNIEKIDRSVDVRGQLCPYPVIEMKLALKRLGPHRLRADRQDDRPGVLRESQLSVHYQRT
jgi:hypothetical protein